MIRLAKIGKFNELENCVELLNLKGFMFRIQNFNSIITFKLILSLLKIIMFQPERNEGL